MSFTTSDAPLWSGTNCSIGDVVGALDDLRRSEQRTATRTSVATLIIVTRTTDEVDEADEVINHLGTRHPARIITLLAPEGAVEGSDRIDADIIMHAGKAEGHAIWSDELRLRVSGGPARHLASLLRPLQLSDLPIVVWYVHGLPDAGDPLLKASTAVIVDTKTMIDPGEGEPAMHRVFESVAQLARKNIIIDLSWNRLRPWRHLMASQFEGEVFRPFAYCIDRVEVTGKLGPRTLLAGWLASRLGLGRDALHLYDGRHVAMSVVSSIDGEQGEFTVARMGDEKLVEASAKIADGPYNQELFALPEDALPQSLASALRRIEHDRVYEHAIKVIGSWK